MITKNNIISNINKCWNDLIEDYPCFNNEENREVFKAGYLKGRKESVEDYIKHITNGHRLGMLYGYILGSGLTFWFCYFIFNI